MKPYICEGTIVRTMRGREGKVVNINREIEVATIRCDSTYIFEKTNGLKVVSYGEVK
jgi:hypothetical protein